MEKVIVPNEVFQAFVRVKNSLSHLQSQDELNRVFLHISLFGQTGDLKTLKEYATNYPTQYLHALVYGYTNDKTETLKQMITEWLDQPYCDSESKDIEMFAAKITEFFTK